MLLLYLIIHLCSISMFCWYGKAVLCERTQYDTSGKLPTGRLPVQPQSQDTTAFFRTTELFHSYITS